MPAPDGWARAKSCPYEEDTVAFKLTARSHPAKAWSEGVLADMFSTGELCDAILEGQGAGFCQAHKILLSLVSPVLRKMIAWETERAGACPPVMTLRLPEVEIGTLRKFVEFVYTGRVPECRGVEDLVRLARLGDLLDVRTLQEVVEDAAWRMLSVETCSALLQCSIDCGLPLLEEHCTQFALRHFERISSSPGFLGLQADVMEGLLGDDRLTSSSEEATYLSFFTWMAAGSSPRKISSLRPDAHICTCAQGMAEGSDVDMEGWGEEHLWGADRQGVEASDEACGLRGVDMLKHIRFPLMSRDFLRDVVSVDAERWGCEELRGMCWAVGDSMGEPEDQSVVAQRTGSGPSLDQWRVLRCVSELRGHAGSVEAVTVWGNSVLSASRDGSIRAWDLHTHAGQACLQLPGGNATKSVYALAVVGDTLFSGGRNNGGSPLHAWDLKEWRHKSALQGHSDAVMALVARGERLWSGSWDTTILEWDAPSLECLRVVASNTVGSILSLAVCGAHLVCNGLHGTSVWNIQNGEKQASLSASCDSKVLALAVSSGPDDAPGGRFTFRCNGRLYTGHKDGKICVWDTRTWKLVASLQGHPEAVTSLAVLGSWLLSTSADSTLRVWNMSAKYVSAVEDTMSLCVHEIRLPSEIVRMHVHENDVYCASKDRSVKVLKCSAGMLQQLPRSLAA
mmetsp:Transcript_11059/g.27109  ORF Transcript_11059/g.27109 Transcript_11059/m.27109 type:complete len:680 (+) Transcript_11059:119-2158(+)